jgi:ribosomal protein S18 acetylase RimI-like enzyme
MNEFFNFAGTDVFLTVREDNLVANRFYEKVGMEKVGYITWSKGKMLGNVWKKSKSA